MSIFEILNREAVARNLSFFVIGGYAVNAYGYVRETADVDILVADQVKHLFEKHGSMDLYRKVLHALS